MLELALPLGQSAHDEDEEENEHEADQHDYLEVEQQTDLEQADLGKLPTHQALVQVPEILEDKGNVHPKVKCAGYAAEASEPEEILVVGPS